MSASDAGGTKACSPGATRFVYVLFHLRHFSGPSPRHLIWSPLIPLGPRTFLILRSTPELAPSLRSVTESAVVDSAAGSATTHRTGGPPVPKRRFHVQWVHIGMQGGGVCIRKISGFVKVTSRSSPTKVRSQIFYVRTSEGHLLPNRAPQSLQCRGVPTGSALRAGALALAPIFTELRAGIGA